MAAAAETLRWFNRSYTQRIGVLEPSFLGSGRSLGLSRLLWEIGPDGTDVLELRSRLGLDSGYVSRMLRQLEDESLVEVVAHPEDRRRRRAELTAAGRREWTRLDVASDRLADDLVGPLTDRQRADLQAALRAAGRLLAAATTTFEVADPLAPDAQQAMTRYFAELDERFPTGFDAGDGAATDAAELAAPTGVLLLARSDGRPVGCGGVRRVDDRTGEVKRMWVDPEWRGLGLSRRLLADLENHARRLGHARVVLDTNGELTEAIALYRSAGYRPTRRYNDNPYAQHWFAKDL